MKRRLRVVIVGGGITGLAAAHSLVLSGAPLQLSLLEGSARLGGCIYTEHLDGFVLEHGADVFLTRTPHARDLCADLGLTIQKPARRRAYIKRDDRLVRLPNGFTGLAPARMRGLWTSPLLSWRGAMRIFLERWVPAEQSGAEESVQAFFTRRYGAQAYAGLVAPLLQGISGGDPNRISVDALLPHLRRAERTYGSLRRARRLAPATGGLVSLEGGLGTLVAALSARLGEVDLRTEAPVRAVTKRGGRFTLLLCCGERIEADVVLIATPAREAALLLRPLSASLAGALDSIRYGATIVVHLGYRSADVPRPLDATGYVAGSGPVTAATWSSAKLAGRAPKGHALIRVFVARKRSDAAFASDDAQLTALACAEVRQSLGITAPPMLTRVHRWHTSLPHYTLGYRERLARIETLRKHQGGLFLAGAAYHGTGIPNCIKSAERAVSVILGTA